MRLHGIDASDYTTGGRETCVFCGTNNIADAAFCTECGKLLNRGTHPEDKQDKAAASTNIDVSNNESAPILTGKENSSISEHVSSSEPLDYALAYFAREDTQRVYSALANIGEVTLGLNLQLTEIQKKSRKARWYRVGAFVFPGISIVLALCLLAMIRMILAQRFVAVGWYAAVGVLFVIVIAIGMVCFSKTLVAVKKIPIEDRYAAVEIRTAIDALQNMAQTLLPLIPIGTRSLYAINSIAEALSVSNESQDAVIAQYCVDSNDYPFICNVPQVKGNSIQAGAWCDTVDRIIEQLDNYKLYSIPRVCDYQRYRDRHTLRVFWFVAAIVDAIIICITVVCVLLFSGNFTPGDESDISYPPYPGGISRSEYEQFVADMTTETNLQSMHTGMWQIADCIPLGISHSGFVVLPDSPAGIRADSSDDFSSYIPNPSSGQYCVTRGGGGADGVDVQVYDSFIPLERDVIDMEPNEKAHRVAQMYLDNVMGR